MPSTVLLVVPDAGNQSVAAINYQVRSPLGWEVFPNLPGLKYPVSRSPRWSVRTKNTASGRQPRSTYWTWPIWTFTLRYEFLREFKNLDEMQQLVGFFNARRSKFQPFLFLDESEYQLTDAIFGIGDGIRTDFAITRMVGGIAEPVGAAIVESLKVAGAVSTAFTLLDDRLIRFNVAPAVGAQLKWSGYYWLRCVFVDETLNIEEFLRKFWSAESVKIETFKP
jgi:hypothetical protein